MFGSSLFNYIIRCECSQKNADLQIQTGKILILVEDIAPLHTIFTN